MPKRRAALVAVPAIAALACAMPALAASKKTVDLGDNYFAPESAKVAKGTTVTWNWTGTAPHNVTVVSGPQRFRSSVQTSGTYSRRLTKVGTYDIVCTIHPGMEMKLKVR